LFPIIYLVLVSLALFPFRHTIVSKQKIVYAVYFFVFGVLVYACLYSAIAHTAFWGDELAIIQTVFGSVFYAIYIASTHVMAPPMDYINLWIWNGMFSFLRSYIPSEVYFRLPYMFLHLISSIFFSWICVLGWEKLEDAKKNSILFDIVAVVSFAAYFFNPLLFWYSIEVKFYTPAGLGSLLCLLLFLRGDFAKLKYLPLLLFFSLISTFQYILVFPLYIFSLKDRKLRTSAIVGILSFTVLWIILRSHLNLLGIVDYNTMITQLSQAFTKFVWFQISSPILFVVVVVAVFLAFWKDEQKNAFRIGGILILYMLTMSLVQYYIRYANFHYRHYVVFIPFFIYVLIYGALSGSVKKRLVVLMCTVIVVIPWFIITLTTVQSTHLPTKVISSFESLYNSAANNNLSIIVVPGTDVFTNNTIRWYAQLYPSVNTIYTTEDQHACLMSSTLPSYILSMDYAIDCRGYFFYQTQNIDNGEILLKIDGIKN